MQAQVRAEMEVAQTLMFMEIRKEMQAGGMHNQDGGHNMAGTPELQNELTQLRSYVYKGMKSFTEVTKQTKAEMEKNAKAPILLPFSTNAASSL